MYPSRYSNGKKVSAAQYVTELICEHKARIDKLDLHYRFWLNKTWATYYRNQIGSANKLLKKYSAKAVIQALNDTQAQKIYSLRAPHLISIIEKYQKIEDEKSQEIQKPDINRSKDIKFHRHKKTNNNIISKLKELDNEDQNR